MPVGGNLMYKLSGGIGMATELYQSHKDKKKPQQPADQTPENVHDEEDSEEEVDDDASAWALDEASEQLSMRPPSYNETDPSQSVENGQETISDKDLAAGFLARHGPPSLSSRSSTELPLPIIIPQRRQREAHRGFVMAYPPLLDECAGIDQETFLDFLTVLNKSCEHSTAFDVANMATNIGKHIPSVVVHFASRGVDAATKIAGEGQSRVQRNTILDKLNKGFFQPRNLWAMIVTWKPQAKQDIIKHHDLLAFTSSNAAPQPGKTHNMTNALSTSSGTTKGHIPIEDCAPLIYPQVDAAALSGKQLPPKTQSSLKANQQVISSYLDKRHKADFAARHRGSALSAYEPSATPFASRWSDPTHPTNSGTLLGVLTGGTFDPRAKRRGKLAKRVAGVRGHEMTEEEVKDVEMGRTDMRGRTVEQRGIQGRFDRMTGYRKHGVRRMVHENMCYLMVVNYPQEGVEDRVIE